MVQPVRRQGRIRPSLITEYVITVTTGMNVAWNTFKPLAKPTVHYGLLPNLLLHTATSSSSITYNTSRTWANTVRLSKLLPGTTYCKSSPSTPALNDTTNTAYRNIIPV